MTKILTFTFLHCLFVSTTIGQTQNLVLTKEQNNKWLDSLKVQPLNSQLLTIKERLLLDTNVFVKQFYNDRIKVADSLGNRVYGNGKPTLIIGGYPMIIDNKTQTNEILSLTKLLTSNSIKEITVLSPNDPFTTVIYGSVGRFGIIEMTVTKKKYAKLFRRLGLVQLEIKRSFYNGLFF